MNQQNIQWTKIQVRQTIGALGIFLSVLILQIFAAVITLALSKVTGITPNSPNYVMGGTTNGNRASFSVQV